jgi:hypothetical protein
MPFWGFLGQTKMMRRCARERGVEEVQQSGGGVPYGVGIERKRPQVSGSPARNLGSLAASLVKLGEGKGRGGRGLLIGTGEGSKWQALIGIKRGARSYCAQ